MHSFPKTDCETNDSIEARSSNSMVLGVGLVMLGATALVMRAYLPLWIFGEPGRLNRMWPVTLFAGYTLLGLIVLACSLCVDRVFDRRPGVSLQMRILAGTILIVAVTGAATATLIPSLSRILVGRDPNLLGMWTLSAVLGTAAYICFLLHRSSIKERQHALHLQLEANMLETALIRSELAMLEAQIEPHFLFNTLAHIKRQYRIDAGTADRMLDALIDYLDRALPALRRDDWTVGDELDLVRTYLEILAQRFGERLCFDIVIPVALRAMRLPALTVATLVENAVRHGLAPKPEGGTISITAAIDQQVVCIDIRDNGAGLRQSSGAGLGLATVRARLRAVFASQGTLVVEAADGGGVLASIRIPART